MKLIYPGPSEAVDLHDFGITAERGKPTDVPDEIAGSLLEQGWTEPKPRKAPAVKKSPGRKAAPNTPQEG